MMQAGSGMGDDDALENFLDSYLNTSFGASGSSTGYTMMQPQQQPQQLQQPQQHLLGGLGGQPPMMTARPASMGMMGQMASPAMAMGEDTTGLSIPALQALLRQRQQLQQQQLAQGGYGQLGGMGGAMGAGVMRPTSLQDHITGGLVAQDYPAWRPTLGTLPTGTGMQTFTASPGASYGEPLPSFQEGGFANHHLAPAPVLRPASDSLLVNQRSIAGLPMGPQGGQAQVQGQGSHGLSCLRTNSLSAQTAAALGQSAHGGSKKSGLFDSLAPPPVAEGSDDSSEDDSSQQRRRGKGRSTSTAHHLPSVQQEKNRSAQRRFRQRQKEKMSYLENRSEVLTAQVEKLSSECESLRNMNTMLEKVLNLREEHISNLQEAAKVFSSLNIGDSDAAGGDVAMKATQDAAAAPSGSPGGAAPAVKSEEGAGGSSGGGAGEAGLTGGAVGLLAGGGGHVLPQNFSGASARFTAEAIRAMSADDVIEAWKENLKELSRYVVLAESSAPGSALPSSVLQRITCVTASMSELVHKVAMISPLNVKRLLATNMELHAMVPVPEHHWSRVLSVLSLSERQRRDLLGARERFLSKFEAVVQERATLVASLSQQAIPRTRVYADICSASLAAHEALDRLRSNLQREHNINMEFVVFVFRGVLDLLQIAKAAVHSYPYYPDVLAMANMLHAQQGGGGGGGSGAAGAGTPTVSGGAPAAQPPQSAALAQQAQQLMPSLSIQSQHSQQMQGQQQHLSPTLQSAAPQAMQYSGGGGGMPTPTAPTAAAGMYGSRMGGGVDGGGMLGLGLGGAMAALTGESLAAAGSGGGYGMGGGGMYGTLPSGASSGIMDSRMMMDS